MIKLDKEKTVNLGNILECLSESRAAIFEHVNGNAYIMVTWEESLGLYLVMQDHRIDAYDQVDVISLINENYPKFICHSLLSRITVIVSQSEWDY